MIPANAPPVFCPFQLRTDEQRQNHVIYEAFATVSLWGLALDRITSLIWGAWFLSMLNCIHICTLTVGESRPRSVPCHHTTVPFLHDVIDVPHQSHLSLK